MFDCWTRCTESVNALVRSLPHCPQGRHGTAASDDHNLCSDDVLPLCGGWGFRVNGVGGGGSGGAVLPVTLYRLPAASGHVHNHVCGLLFSI